MASVTTGVPLADADWEDSLSGTRWLVASVTAGVPLAEADWEASLSGTRWLVASVTEGASPEKLEDMCVLLDTIK